MKVSQLWTIDTAYAQWASPEIQCSLDYDNFFEYKFNQCFCKESPQSASVLCEMVTASALCERKYGNLFTKVDGSDQCLCGEPDKDGAELLCSSLAQTTLNALCTSDKPLRDTKTESCIACSHGLTTDGTACLANNYGDIGLKCSAEDILNNTCTWNINKTLGIKASNPIPNPEVFVQDIVLGATSFVGTGVFIALVVMWFKAVAQGWSGSEDQMGKIKSWFINLLIGVALIMLSYTIIRIVQYVARGY